MSARTQFVAIVRTISSAVVFIGGIATITDSVVYPSTGNGFGLVTRVGAVEGTVRTSCGAWLIAAVVTVAVIIVDLNEFDGTATVQTSERVLCLVQTGTTDGHATGTWDICVHVGNPKYKDRGLVTG